MYVKVNINKQKVIHSNLHKIMEVSKKIRSQLAFFNITPETAPQIRYNLFDLIDEIVSASEGAYKWNDIYYMPIWLRKFTFNKLKDRIEKRNAQKNPQKQNQNILISPDGTINKQAFQEANKNMTGKTSYK